MVQLTLGVEYDLPPIPLEEGCTIWFPAGLVTFGMEERVLDEAKISAAFSAQQRADSTVEDVKKGAVREDGGLSIHVCDAASRQELLRFDCFAATPHYHYIPVGGGNIAVAFDASANGEMLPWVMTCLRSHLPSMLTRAGAGELADSISTADVDAAIEELVACVDRFHEEEPDGQTR